MPDEREFRAMAGKNPLKLSPDRLAELLRAGRVAMGLEGCPGDGRKFAQAIRAKCVDCSGGSVAEVERCAAVFCPLWPFRTGKNPFDSRRGVLPAHLRRLKDAPQVEDGPAE